MSRSGPSKVPDLGAKSRRAAKVGLEGGGWSGGRAELVRVTV